MGNRDLLTGEALKWIEESDLIIGAKRMTELFEDGEREACHAYLKDEIESCLKSHSHCRKAALLLSGDVGFFSGAKNLTGIFPEARVMPGISSLSYFCSKLPCSWEDVSSVSLHGKKDNVAGILRERGRVFVILGKGDDLQGLCQRLKDCGLENACVSVGENLGYPEEKITPGRAEDFPHTETSLLSVCLLELKEEAVCTCGIGDHAFIRGNVPMTKEEIRSIILSKMKLTRKAVVYDIGAGTGSVSVELARTAFLGEVYAIEEKPEAVELILKNLKEIIEMVLKKNLRAGIVVSAVSLETIGEAFGEMKALEERFGRKTEITALSVAKSKVLGEYHMMMGGNPVYLFESYVL